MSDERHWIKMEVEVRRRNLSRRLDNSGFDTGEEGDAQYDAMTEGWKLFLLN